MEVIKAALLGLGTVGTGVWKLVTGNANEIEQKIGCRLEIARVLVRDPRKRRLVAVPPDRIGTDFDAILHDPEINLVVEVMGGIEPAKSYILQALHAGKNVVTANKDLLALHGRELFDAEAEHGTDLFFEASVAGGIPIIHALKESLAANKIETIMGIINGTTNYILTKMTEQGRPYEEVLGEAQRLGYAEADPAADVDGLDAARKLAILASIAFGTRITVNDVFAEGIRRITSTDIQYARELGYVIKLVGIARAGADDAIEVRVHPAFIPAHHPLAAVQNEFNAIFVRGDAVGETMFYGRGAGELPTASAVVGDMIAVARDLRRHVTGRIGCTCYNVKRIKSMGEVKCRYYLRLAVQDQPGVLASIAGVFGSQGVSLATVLQQRTLGEAAELVLITHEVYEQYLNDALRVIEGLPTVAAIANIIRVEGEN